MMDAGIALVPLFFMLGFGCLGLIGTVFWIWVLIDCLKNEPNEGTTKLVWAIVILLLQFLGALLYFFLRRPERRREFGR